MSRRINIRRRLIQRQRSNDENNNNNTENSINNNNNRNNITQVNDSDRTNQNDENNSLISNTPKIIYIKDNLTPSAKKIGKLKFSRFSASKKDLSKIEEEKQKEENNFTEIKDTVKCYICFDIITKPKMCASCHRIACEKCLYN